MGRRPKQTFLQRRHTDGQQTWKDAQHAHYCCCCSVACHFRLFVIPWTTAYQASLSFTTSLCLLKPISTELVMPSNHLILCCPLLLLPSIFPSIRVFSNELALCISGQSTGASASASVLPMNIQDWFPLALTGLISMQSKWLLRVFSSTKVQKHPVAPCRIFSCGIWDLIPLWGFEPGPPVLGPWSLSHWTTREVSVLSCA